MANGAPNGHRRPPSPEEIAIARANAEDQARQQLAAVLQGTLTSPVVGRRAYTSLPMVAVEEDDVPAIYVALPDGERWEIPLTRGASDRIVKALTEHWERVDQAKTDGTRTASGLEVVEHG
jgi:hypothetical protein